MRKNNKILFLFLAVLFNARVNAQPVSAWNKIGPGDLKIGPYFTFEDFRNNKPEMESDSFIKILNEEENSLSLNFFSPNQFKKKATDHEIEMNGTINYKMEKSILSGKDTIEHIWGYNDGKSIFCFHELKFFKIIFIGKYCILEFVRDKFLRKGGNLTGFTVGKIDYLEEGPNTVKTEQAIMNFANGEISKITEATVFQMLSTDIELKEKFLKDKSRRSFLVSYVMEYDLKHPLTLKSFGSQADQPQEEQEVKWKARLI